MVVLFVYIQSFNTRQRQDSTDILFSEMTLSRMLEVLHWIFVHPRGPASLFEVQFVIKWGKSNCRGIGPMCQVSLAGCV